MYEVKNKSNDIIIKDTYYQVILTSSCVNFVRNQDYINIVVFRIDSRLEVSIGRVFSKVHSIFIDDGMHSLEIRATKSTIDFVMKRKNEGWFVDNLYYKEIEYIKAGTWIIMNA